MLEFSDKVFKAAIITMFNDIKTNTFIINGQIGNYNRKIENIKKNQMKILELNIWNLKIHWMDLMAK